MFASGKAQPGSPWASSLEMVLETCFCPARLTMELSLPASLIRAGIRERSPGFPAVRRDTVLYQRLHLRFLHRLRICRANKSCNHPAGDSDMPLGRPLQTSLKNQSRNTFFNKKKFITVTSDVHTMPDPGWGTHPVLKSMSSWDQRSQSLLGTQQGAIRQRATHFLPPVCHPSHLPSASSGQRRQ